MITCRLSTPEDVPAILGAIARSNSTDRTRETWTANKMMAVVAEDHGAIVGLIPFEPRHIVGSGASDLRVAWISGAHVDEGRRNEGIGTLMDSFAAQAFAGQHDAIAAFRHDEGTAAFRWYARLGFVVVTPILSLKRRLSAQALPIANAITDIAEVEKLGPTLLSTFNQCHGQFTGYMRRDSGFWARTMRTHYYGAHYDYRLVLSDAGYAFTGVTALKDGVHRAEILDWATADGDWDTLLASAEADAKSQGLAELRLQTALSDPVTGDLMDRGFQERWRTNVVMRFLSDKTVTGSRWRHFQVDYV